MDKSREQFEEWAQSNRFNIEKLNDCNGNECKWYANAATDMQWDAWQASRAALVVDLPPQHEWVLDGYDAIEVSYALKQAGIKCS